MADHGAKAQRFIALCLLGALLFNFPVLAAFNIGGMVFGVPILYAYVLGAWAALVALLALVAETKR
ncbi:MAG: hypothetical protein JO035_09830 [Betaproteobacteria bacterium]|nr:hypothetical protein [Betaproteobacteria bacterium]